MDEAQRKQQEKRRQMMEAPVEGLICRLAVPCIISMMITAFYNLADTFFVGMLHSNSATGAVGIAFSLMAIIQAIGFFFGHGVGNYVSRELGRQNRDGALEMAATGFCLVLVCSTVIALLCQLFLTPLVRLLGSTETILPYAREYVRIILIGMPWMCTSLLLNNLLRFQGSAIYSMLGITAGAVVNVALDPLLIFGFHLGVSGAAIATIISQFISFCLLLAGCRRGGNLPIALSRIRVTRHNLLQIVRGGLPSLGRQGMASIGTIVLNHSAGLYGDAAIAAMSIVTRCMMMAVSAMIGFGQGFQPVCGFNYGAKRWDRVYRGFWFCVKVAAVFLTIVAAAAAVFAPQIISLFRDDPEVIACGATAMRLQCMLFPLSAWVVCSNMALQTVDRTIPATILAVGRNGLFLIPALLILTPTLGLLGVQLAQPVADLLTFLVAIPCQGKLLRELKAGPPAEET